MLDSIQCPEACAVLTQLHVLCRQKVAGLDLHNSTSMLQERARSAARQLSLLLRARSGGSSEAQAAAAEAPTEVHLPAPSAAVANSANPPMQHADPWATLRRALSPDSSSHKVRWSEAD